LSNHSEFSAVNVCSRNITLTRIHDSTKISIVPPQTIPSSLASSAVSEKWCNSRFAGAHGRFRLGPNFSLDAAAADRSRNFAVLKEKHFRTTLLRRRATRVRDGGDNDTLATVAASLIMR
jgi:hypothetical protein